MPISFGSIQLPEQGIQLYINGVEYTSYSINYSFRQVDNEVSGFFVELIGISSDQRSADVLQDKVVRFESEGVLLYKGLIEHVEYQTGLSVTITGVGSGESLLKRLFATVTPSADLTSGVSSPQYTATALSTIISEQITSVSGVVVDSVDSGVELGSGTYRGDHISKLTMVANPVIVKKGKWWFTHGNSSPYTDNIYHASDYRGSASPVKVFNIGGDSQNVNLTSNEKDFENLWNDVEVLGRGDGINQLRSKSFHATTTRSFLSSNIDSTQTTIPLEDASVFPAIGSALIGIEKIRYGGKSGNDLTNVTRGIKVSPIPPNDSTTRALYYFNAGSGSTISDAKNNYNGSWVGTPFWSSTTAIEGNSVGPFTDNNYISISGSLTNISTGAVECWFYPTESNRRQQLVRQTRADISVDHFNLTIESNNKVNVQVDVQNSTPLLISTDIITLNQWHHVLVNWGSPVHSLYLDGVFQVSGSTGAGTGNIASMDVWIGKANEAANYFNGYIDNVVIISGTAATPTLLSGYNYAHSKGIEVYDAQYNEDNAQSGSSIARYGLKQYSLQDKSIINQDSLDNIAQNERNTHDDLVTRIQVEPSDPYDSVRSVSIGDTITVMDSDSDLSGNYAVVSREFKSDNGLEILALECSNSKLSLTKELSDASNLSNVESRFMQGSTALITVNETENAESGIVEPGPIDVFFEIPAEVVAINQIKLAYRNEKPRIWNKTGTIAAVETGINDSAGEGDISLSPTSATDWKDVFSTVIGSSTTQMFAVGASARVYATTGSPGNVFLRLADSTAGRYYPDSTGTNVAYGTTDANTFSTSMIPLIWFGKNNSTSNFYTGGNTFKLQVATTNSSTVTVFYKQHFWGAFTNTNDYDIDQQTYTTNNIRLYTTNNADGIPAWTEQTTNISGTMGRALRAGDEQVETNVDLTTYFSGTGFKGVRLATNGNSRHKIQLTAKVFVDAKKV